MTIKPNQPQDKNPPNEKIFLLTPLKQSGQFETFLIWSDDETTAREKTTPVSLAGRPKDNPGIIDIKFVSFYRDQQNASCKQLQKDIDYSFLHNLKNILSITYQGEMYALEKDKPYEIK